MPLQERFGARPMGRASFACPVSRNYQFRSGQQPKPQNFLLSLCVTTYMLKMAFSDASFLTTMAGVCPIFFFGKLLHMKAMHLYG
jgi:hypothetical protein